MNDPHGGVSLGNGVFNTHLSLLNHIAKQLKHLDIIGFGGG